MFNSPTLDANAWLTFLMLLFVNIFVKLEMFERFVLTRVLLIKDMTVHICLLFIQYTH